ncbi:MAG: ankyrin repeat domain-containing protein, partial [Rhodospirillales bacterium]|nr:ankyrin repeat domain-containing protein [Rhodospirillales bacterium]
MNAKNRRGSTPLHWAIHDEAKVRLLLSKGANVNARQAQGRTPLYLAVSNVVRSDAPGALWSDRCSRGGCRALSEAR